MTDRSIRIDDETARQVAELAHLMETTKKAVLADAVAAYARARLPALADGRVKYGDLSPRERLALRRDELLRLFERQGSTNVRVLDDPTPDVLAHDGPGPDDPTHDGLTAVGGPGDGLTAVDSPGDGLTAVGGPGDDRSEPFGEALPYGGAIVLLAETDLMLGGEAAPMLEDVARRLLGVPVEVISATGLALFAPERLERLVRMSTPLRARPRATSRVHPLRWRADLEGASASMARGGPGGQPSRGVRGGSGRRAPVASKAAARRSRAVSS